MRAAISSPGRRPTPEAGSLSHAHQRQTVESSTPRRRANSVHESLLLLRYAESDMTKRGYCQMAGSSSGSPAPGEAAVRQSPRAMGKKTPEDLEAEARVRAHLRQQMAERHISRAELARRVGSDDGNMTRILDGERGIGLGLVLRICRGLSISPTRLLLENAPKEYGDPWVKNHTGRKP